MQTHTLHPDIQAVLDGRSQWCVIAGDCLQVLPLIPAGSVGAVVTDPPYGCDNAEWDVAFPTEWYNEARRVSTTTCIITGSAGLADSIPLVGSDFVDVIAARNMNGMTRGPIGFGNWLAAVVAGDKPRQGPNAFDFVVRDDMPDHPSPKPIEYMERIVARMTERDALILDPSAAPAQPASPASKPAAASSESR